MGNRHRRLCGRIGLALLGALSALSLHSNAFAAGLYFSDRGVRPMGRGGAFVAGADDLGALYYNPAGLTDAKQQVLADVSWLLFHSEYTRQSRIYQVDPNTGQPTGQSWNQTFPTAKGSAPILPIPTLAVSNQLGLKNTVFALGLWAPEAAGARYEQRVAGGPNPGRYMLLNLDGSALVVPGVWVAHEVAPWLSVGAGFELLVGTYKAQSVLSTCLPDRFLCANEDPNFDSTAQMSVGPIAAPGGNLGITIKPTEYLRIGASYQLPFWIDAPASVQVRIPSNPFFDRARQDGDSARVSMRLPWIARVGVEGRLKRFRAEVAFVYEAWSMHDEIKVTPQNMILRDVELFPAEYRVQSMSIPRHFQDTQSLRFGGETWFDVGGYQLDLRAGLMLEKGAIPKAYLSTLTIDSDKAILGLGGSIHIQKNWRFDWTYSRVMASSVTVSPDKASYPQLSPVRANPSEYPNYVNGGRYEASANVLGVGLAVNYL